MVDAHFRRAAVTLIEGLKGNGEDPSREGLEETPKRFAKAWGHYTKGYYQDAESILKTFSDGADRYDEMVFQGDIPLYSMCEHHLAPFFGKAYIAYVPIHRVVGLSKLVRVVDMFARRLQIQERMAVQIADALQGTLKPLGVGVMLRCRHMCMESRGVAAYGTVTVTTALRGCFKSEPDARAEFLHMVEMNSSGASI